MQTSASIKVGPSQDSASWQRTLDLVNLFKSRKFALWKVTQWQHKFSTWLYMEGSHWYLKVLVGNLSKADSQKSMMTSIITGATASWDKIPHYESALIYLVFQLEQVRKSSSFVRHWEVMVNFWVWRWILSPCAKMGPVPSWRWDPLMIHPPMSVYCAALSRLEVQHTISGTSNISKFQVYLSMFSYFLTCDKPKSWKVGKLSTKRKNTTKDPKD